MESSRHGLGSEGCSSSESGWTMYIASPMQEDRFSDNEDSDDVNRNINNHFVKHNHVRGKANDDSDDSMASDASSGPSYLQQAQHKTGKAKNDKAHKLGKNSTKKKDDKQEKKRGKRFF